MLHHESSSFLKNPAILILKYQITSCPSSKISPELIFWFLNFNWKWWPPFNIFNYFSYFIVEILSMTLPQCWPSLIEQIKLAGPLSSVFSSLPLLYSCLKNKGRSVSPDIGQLLFGHGLELQEVSYLLGRWFSIGGNFCLPESIWKHLETEKSATTCIWHLEQKCY